MKAAAGRGRRNRIRDTIMVEDPCQDRCRVGTLGEDYGPLDHHAPGYMRTGKTSHERAYRVCCHSFHSIPRSIGSSMWPMPPGS